MTEENRDFSNLIKLTDPHLALERNLQFRHPDANALGKGILRLRKQVKRLARDLKRSISGQDQLGHYLADLIAFQELLSQLGPIQDLTRVLDVLFRISQEMMQHRGAVVYFWGQKPLEWKRKKSAGMDPALERAIEGELARESILDGSERDALVIPFLHQEEGSLILIPLLSGDRSMGVFIAYVAASHLNYFGHHIHMFTMFGSAATIALENALLFEKVKSLSIKDDLTELYNARYLWAFLEKALKTASHYKPVALFFMDLDNFKRVNDLRGHVVGSQVLVETARLLQSFAEKGRCVARYGGDEFVIALPNTKASRAMNIAEEIREAVASHEFHVEDNQHINLTISIGVSMYPHQASDVEELINFADMAMYDAKDKGKNRVVLSEAEGHTLS